jgi:hypothetical protein
MSHILMAFYVRPVFGENLPAKRVNLNLPGARHACPFQTKIKTADACKQ